MGFPMSFYLALGLLLVLSFELFLRRRKVWALPTATVCVTVE